MSKHAREMDAATADAAAVPQEISDALAALQATSVALSVSKGALSAAQAGLAAAQQQVEGTASDVTAKADQLNKDRDTLIHLIQTTYAA